MLATWGATMRFECHGDAAENRRRIAEAAS
jgi:hypothetical protein